MTRIKLVPTAFDRAVWTACPYVDQWMGPAHAKRKCKNCTSYEIDVETGEKYTRHCRAMAEEILEPALEAYHNE